MGLGQGIRAVTAPATLAGSPTTVLNHATRLCGWCLQDEGNLPVVEALDTVVAAAAAGSLTLTGFQTVSLVTVTPAAAWPAGVNQVTLTNVTGGTQTVDIEGGTANPAILSFPLPVPTTGTPVVSVPAIVGGPAYTIEAVGTIAAASFPESQAIGKILDGAQLLGVSAPVKGLTDTQWLSDEGVYVGSNLILSSASGLIGGVFYIRDVDEAT